MNIFVTGATGFFGAHFINHAISQGHSVVAVRRTESSQPRIPLLQNPTWINRQLSEITHKDFEGVDCVLHLAACGISPRTAPWQALIDVNVLQPLALFRAASVCGVSNWVAVGSYAEYGETFREYKWVPPNAALRPTSGYASSKAAFSLLLPVVARECNAKLIYARVNAAYGHGQFRDNLWPSLWNAAKSGLDFPMTFGEQIRDFVPISYVVDQLLADCLTSEVPFGTVRTRNIGTSSPQSVKDFAEMWWSKWEAKGQLLIGALPYRTSELMRCITLNIHVDL